MNNISMHILDIAQNSIRANASCIEISISEIPERNILELTINDNGSGMDAEMLNKVTDPYTTSRTTRKVGLGLPLLKQSAEQSGGFVKVNSEKGVGTSVYALFKYDHIDRPPLGDCGGTIILLVAANPKIDFRYIHSYNSAKYEFDTNEVKQALGDADISNPKIRTMLKEMVTENIKELYV
jgi:hypothetical protein